MHPEEIAFKVDMQENIVAIELRSEFVTDSLLRELLPMLAHDRPIAL